MTRVGSRSRRRRSSTTSAASRISARWCRTCRPRRTSGTTRTSSASARSCASSRPRPARSPTPRYNPLGRSAKAVLDEAEAKVLHIAEQGCARCAAIPGDRHAARGRRRAHRDALQPRRSVRRHRRADGLLRSRPDDLRPAAGRPRRRRGPAEHGQDRAGAQHRRARRARTRLPVVVFSMEMGASQLAMRMIGSVGGSTSTSCAPGGWRAEDWDKLSAALGPPERGADPDRRDAGAQCDRGALARATADEAVRQARARDRRLPAADAGVDARARIARPRSRRSRAR